MSPIKTAWQPVVLTLSTPTRGQVKVIHCMKRSVGPRHKRTSPRRSAEGRTQRAGGRKNPMISRGWGTEGLKVGLRLSPQLETAAKFQAPYILSTQNHKHLTPNKEGRYFMDENVALLTSSHPLWEKFCEGLAGGTCAGTLFIASALLEHYAKSMSIDVEGTLDYLRDNGGHCDCEVILNIYYG